eukprot:200945_1
MDELYADCVYYLSVNPQFYWIYFATNDIGIMNICGYHDQRIMDQDFVGIEISSFDFSCNIPLKYYTQRTWNRSIFSKFILIENKDTSWAHARVYCQSVFGTDLAVIVSDDDWNEITEIRNAIEIWKPTWVAYQSLAYLSDKNGKNKWAWIYGGNYSLESINWHYDWINGLYNNMYESIIDLLEQQFANNNYIPIYFYDFSMYPSCGYIKTNHDPKEFHIYPEFCDTNLHFMCQSTNKFMIVVEFVTWNDAYKYCENRNYTLFDITDTDDIDMLEVKTMMYTSLAWFDGYQIVADYAWINSENNELCVSMNYFGITNPGEDCNKHLPFICQRNDDYIHARNISTQITQQTCLTNCWKRFDEITPLTKGSEYNSLESIQQYLGSAPPIAYWNDKLYIFSTINAKFQLCYATIDYPKPNNILQLYRTNLHWSCDVTTNNIVHEFFVDFLKREMMNSTSYIQIACYGNQCIQYENMLYMIGQIESINKLSVIISIDLNKLSIQIHEYHKVITIDNDREKVTDACLATNGTHIFLINEVIEIYNIQKALEQNDIFIKREFYQHLWSEEKGINHLIGSGCAMNWNNTYLYIFGGTQHENRVAYDPDKPFNWDFNNPYNIVGHDNIVLQTVINNKTWKYDTNNNILSLLPVEWNYNPRFLIKTLLAPNGNIYFYDGISDSNSGYYPIFNTKTEMFINNRITRNEFLTTQKYQQSTQSNDYIYNINSLSNAIIYDNNALLRINAQDIYAYYSNTPWECY